MPVYSMTGPGGQRFTMTADDAMSREDAQAELRKRIAAYTEKQSTPAPADAVPMDGVARTAAPATPALTPAQKQAIAQKKAERGIFGQAYDAVMGNEIEAPEAYTAKELAARQKQIADTQKKFAADAAKFDKLAEKASKEFKGRTGAEAYAAYKGKANFARKEIEALQNEFANITQTGLKAPKASKFRETLSATLRTPTAIIAGIPGAIEATAGYGLGTFGLPGAETLKAAGKSDLAAADEFGNYLFGAQGEALNYDATAKFLADVGGGVGSVGTFLGPGLLSKAAGAGKGLVGAARAEAIAKAARPLEYGLGTVQGAQQGIQDIQATEQRTGEVIPDANAFAAILLNAGLGATEVGVARRIFESVPVAQRGAALDTVTDIVRRGTAGRVDPKVISEAVKRTLNTIESRAAGRIAVRGAEEAGQEGLVQAGTNVIAKGLYDEDRDITEGVGYSALIGGIVGSGLRGVTEVAQKALGKAKKQGIDPKAVMAEFQRVAAEQVGKVMKANPGMKKNDAVKFVEDNAEALFNLATANIVSGTKGVLDVPVTTGAGMDDLGGSGAGTAVDRESLATEGSTTVAGADDDGRLDGSVSGVSVPTTGTGTGVGTLIEPTAKQVKAMVPTIEQAFEASAVDFEDAYADVLTKDNKLNAEQKKQAARIIIQSPEVDPYDAIGSVLDRGLRLRGEQVPSTSGIMASSPAPIIPVAPSLDEQAVAPIRDAIKSVITPTGGAIPTLAQTTARQLGIAPTAPPAPVAPPVEAPPVAPPVEAPPVAPPVEAPPVEAPPVEAPPVAAAPVRDDTISGAVYGAQNNERNPLTYEDLIDQLDFLEDMAVRGKLTPERLASSDFGQVQDIGTLTGLKDRIAADPVGTIQRLRESAELNNQRDMAEAAPVEAVQETVQEVPLSREEKAIYDPADYTPQEIYDDLERFGYKEATRRGYTDTLYGMFGEGVREAKNPFRSPEQYITPMTDEFLLEKSGPEALAAYKEGQQFGKDAVAAVQEPVQDTKIEISPEGNPETEAEYITDATRGAAQAILNNFMVGDQVRMGNTPGVVVGLDGDYVRVRPDSARNAKAYTRVPKASVEFVYRPDTATTVSASKVEGQDAKFGEEAGQLNADMAGLIQLLGANMYAANVADVSVKELLQNAFDAVKGAISGKRAPALYQNGEIDITLNLKNRTITIKDNARGMTPEIVRDAFFTVAGSDKSDLDPQERSGGLGLAKMGFMMGAESIQLDTVRDGVRVTVDATSKEIAGSNFTISKSPAPAGEHGTTVTVKIPETYTDPKTGEEKIIWFPSGKDSIGILNKPLIGPAEIKFTFKGGYGSENPEVLPLGTNFPYDDYQKLEVKFEWGSADIYYGKDRKKYPEHQVLSSGVYQFDTRFDLNQNERIPYDIIVNVKSDVEAKHQDYPFENSRERFKGRLKADIDSLGSYLAKVARGAEAADLKDTMQNVVSLPRVEVGEDLKGLEGKLKKSFEKSEGPARTLPQLPTQVTITDLGVFDLGGKTIVDKSKEAEKKKESTFEATEEAPTRDDFMIELDQDPRNPIFHNNTSFDPIEVGTPYGEPAKFFAELGSIFVEMKEFMAASGMYGYDQLSPENFFYAGIGIDKQYGGLHTKVPYKSVLVNPFYDQFGARTLNGMQSQILDTMIHEIAHIQEMKHNEYHNSAMLRTKLYLADEGMLDYFSDNIMNTLLRHESAYTAMRDEYGRSTTQNIAKSLEDYGKSGNASREVGTAPSGRPDASGAVPAGREQSGGSDIQASASASPEGPESGGTGGGSEPLTDANVEKAVSVKLTKAQIKRLETAAGIRGRDVNSLQMRIIQSRNDKETKTLIKRLAEAMQNRDGNSGIIASLTQSMPLSLYKSVLGFQQIEDIFRLAKLAGMKSIGRIDTMMREEYIPYVNRIVRRASVLEQEWTAFAARDPDGNTTLDDTIMYSNMLDADPSLAATAAEYMRIDPKLKELQDRLATETNPNKQKSLKGQITTRKEDIKRLYFGGELKDEDGKPITIQGWNALPPEGKKIFKAARDFHRNNFNEHYRLLMQRIDDAKFDSNDAVKLKSSVEQMFNKARERTIYFPVKRFGEYWLSVGNDFYMRESAAEIKALKKRLKKEGETRAMVLGTSRADLRNKVASNDASSALKGILDALDGRNTKGEPKVQDGDIEGLRDLIFQMYLTALPEADMRRRFVHRRFVTGFSTDALRTFAATAVASANQLGRLAYNYKFQNIIEEAKAESESDELTPYRDALRSEIEERVKSVLAPDTNSALLNAFNAFIAFGSKVTFYHHLSSAASAIINLTQLHILGLPVLSGEFGEAKTAAMAARYTTSLLAGREIPNPFRDKNGNLALQAPEFKFENSAYMRSLKKNDPDRYKQTAAAWEYAQDHDVIESTFASSAQLYGRSNTPTGDFNFQQAVRRGKLLTAGQRGAAAAMNAMGFMFHSTETIGRGIMYMSSFDLAYERAIDQGKTAEQAGMEARKLAADLTNKAMFDFSNWNKSRFAKAPAGRFALQMTSYIHSLSSLLLRSFVGMIPFLNKEGKAAAARVFFGSAGVTALYGGLRSTQFYALTMGAYTLVKYVESLLEDDDEEEDIKQGYIGTKTIERNLLKYADKNGNSLGKKDMEYYIRSTFIPETFGKKSTLKNALGISDKAAANLATAADMGIPALFGVDISGSVAMGDLPFIGSRVDVKGDTLEVRAAEATTKMALGPAGSVIISYLKGVQAWNNGDIDQAVEAFVPSVIRNRLKALRLQEEGLKIGKNKDVPLKNPSYYTDGKVFLQSLGFKDAETSRNMQLDMLAIDVEREIAEQNTDLLNRRYRAVLDVERNPSEKNKRKLAEVERDISIFTLNYPSSEITLDTKERSRKAKQRDAADRAYGIGFDRKSPIRQATQKERLEQLLRDAGK